MDYIKNYLSIEYKIQHILILKREHLKYGSKNCKIEEIEFHHFSSSLPIIHSNIESSKSFVETFQQMDFVLFVDGEKTKILKSKTDKTNQIISTPIFL